jgi:NAD kinase
MAAPQYENVIIVTRKTGLDDLVARFNTKAQARFYLEHAGQSFQTIEAAHRKHHAVLAKVRKAVPGTVKSQVIDRELVPRFTFGDADLVVTVGQDGLVSNTAKYLSGQPILAVNPDPDLYDGVLLPFTTETVGEQLNATLYGRLQVKPITLAMAQLSDGQRLLAFNDFFIGVRSHVSARYRIEIGDQAENQSSSGIIVSTGAGSTGWLQSVYAGAAGVVEALGGRVIPPPNGGRFSWDTEQLVYSVREPFPSIATQTSIVHGVFTNRTPLRITSQMPTNGVIFSDGVEADYLEFNSGSELTVTTAPKQALLVVPPEDLTARRDRIDSSPGRTIAAE